jgi:hypothetical protein
VYIPFLENYAVVLAAGQSWHTDWVPYPEDNHTADLLYACKSYISGTLNVRVETTWDSDTPTDLGGPQIGAVLVGITDLPNPGTGFGPFVRLHLDALVDTLLLISVWLTPKREDVP